MSLVALVEPQTLLGQSLREALEAEPGVELLLLGDGEEDFGTLTEVRGEVTVVGRLTAEALAGADLAILCGDAEQQQRALDLLPEATRAVIVATDFLHPAGALRVSGVSGEASQERVVVSPHPAVVLLVHLLAALAPHRPRRLTGSVFLPASSRGSEGLDELFEQTRSILSFTGEQPQSVFGRQLAFNLLPPYPETHLDEQVRASGGGDVEVCVSLLTAPVFHGVAASLTFELTEPADPETVATTLGRSPFIELDASEAGVSPIDIAGRDEILVGTPLPDPGRPEAVRIWAVMDNLTRGGSANVIDLVREMLPSEGDT